MINYFYQLRKLAHKAENNGLAKSLGSMETTHNDWLINLVSVLNSRSLRIQPYQYGRHNTPCISLTIHQSWNSRVSRKPPGKRTSPEQRSSVWRGVHCLYGRPAIFVQAAGKIYPFTAVESIFEHVQYEAQAALCLPRILTVADIFLPSHWQETI